MSELNARTQTVNDDGFKRRRLSEETTLRPEQNENPEDDLEGNFGFSVADDMVSLFF